MFQCMVRAGLVNRLSGDVDWCQFWHQARSEDWGASHPVQSWPEESRRKAIAISLHGDEGTGKRSKSVMILSWSPLAVHDAAMMSKYPFCVIKSDFFFYKDGTNVTLDKLQESLAMSLNRCNLPGDAATDGWSMHLVVHKGDWKFRRDWLHMDRRYNNADLICPRCLASAKPNSDRPWLDPCRERFNAAADIRAAAETRILDICFQ
ncbi:TY1B-DR3 [Symbiodinium necroappetens]|uniref:TY1B-DR3 protein n=1 Tax=Symbiodinium necroappetens TaxID=1628268 RepID=A0A812UWV1_9DINO|nr:TY1B-DR3 [Symbiodinium necroappetens]